MTTMDTLLPTPATEAVDSQSATDSPIGLAAVTCSAFVPEDRRFYWWRCGPDGHWLIVMVRNGLCLMPGFSQAHKVADQKGEFWPVPLNPPSWPNDPDQATASTEHG